MNFSSWILSEEQNKSIVHTTLPMQQFDPVASWIFTTVEFNGVTHGFMSFKMCYMLSLSCATFILGFVFEMKDHIAKSSTSDKTKKD